MGTAHTRTSHSLLWHARLSHQHLPFPAPDSLSLQEMQREPWGLASMQVPGICLTCHVPLLVPVLWARHRLLRLPAPWLATLVLPCS